MYAAILAASAGTLIAVSVLLHRAGAEHRLGMLRDGEAHAVGMRQDAVSGLVEATVADLLFLSELNELDPFLAAHTPANRQALSTELAGFARRQGIYERVQILTPLGTEILRIDDRDGASVEAPFEELGYEAEALRFLETADCTAGAVYVSAFDLSAALAPTGASPRPIVRFGLALASSGDVAGFLLLSLKGSVLIDAFAEAHPDPETLALLADADGAWIRGPLPAGKRGQDPPDRPSERFQALFPAEWETISTSASGQFLSEHGLFTYDTLMPSVTADAARCAITGSASTGDPATDRWKNVSWVPRSVLVRTRRAGAAGLAGWDVFGVLVLGSGSWVLVRWLARRSDLHRRTSEERELLRSTLRKYMSPEVCDRVLVDPARHARLGGASQDVAVLFADIRGFTRFTERQDPEYVVAVLNRTMAELTAPLRVYGGILDKYIGDGFLAFFEETPGLASAAQRAVAAARVMHRAFRSLWGDAPSEALRELGLGIGIGGGRVVVGNVGSEDAMDYTVVGDAVNVASRLQSLAESGDILVSESAYALLEEERDAKVMRLTRLRGRSEPMNVYRLRVDLHVA